MYGGSGGMPWRASRSSIVPPTRSTIRGPSASTATMRSCASTGPGTTRVVSARHRPPGRTSARHRPHDLAVYTGGSGAVLAYVALEPRENRAEERVLDQPADDLERARLRVVERTRDVGDRCHFPALTVLQDLGGDADRALVDLLHEAL